jgi:short-subunit dehydrogenase involved in D-alanine esterification of teichoic acids
MKKEAFNFNVNEENKEEFAVIPHEDLIAIAQLVNVISKQMGVLEVLLGNAGITMYSFEKQTKTLADVKVVSDDLA